VKFTPAGGAIGISSEALADAVEIAVTDTGIGIALEEQAAIFDEFHQASAATSGVREGTGLGLAITQRLVTGHGGIAVADLRFEHVDAAVSGMIEDELSPKTIHNAVTLLRTILTGRKGPSALRRGVAFRDSTLGIELPPLQSRQITPPTPEQMWKLINTAKEIGGLGYPLTYLAAFTGVRRNEALALRFDDVEWFTNEVNVRHAISKRRRKDGGRKWEWHVGPPKSRKSVRRIAATESVMKMLAELKVGKPGTAFLFPGNCSGFIDPDMFDAGIWRPIAREGGDAWNPLS